ncbi:hypothetical protein BCR42DRAFT_421642 [Absidia repens]|uniref:Mitochondrial pyruvate carrier n=1 Tax=Absidia repens TaxID=90262 RepID=A0A1X2I7V1_9FUNG|nr:hypothetical protein BCR42DRAFT_421642 [Absidia repens]
MSQASGSIANRISQKLASKGFRDYFMSTHFWGPVANWGIPLAAIGDTQKDASLISGNMTAALCVYSALFMRFALAVQPTNYLLFACHFVNEGAQLTQGYRYLQYNKFGGKEKAEAQKTTEESKVVAE